MSVAMEDGDPAAAKAARKAARKAEKRGARAKRKLGAMEDGGEVARQDDAPRKKHKSSKTSAAAAIRPATRPRIDPDRRESSPFCQETHSLYLPISPITQLHPLAGVCAEHLSPLILTYHPPFHAVILSYTNVRFTESPGEAAEGEEGIILAQSVNEYAVSYAWVTADFLLFKPRRGIYIEGWINLQNEGHIGLVCWNLFNASIERKRLPGDWKWKGAGLGPGRTRLKSGGDQNEELDAVDDEEPAETGHFEKGDGSRVEGAIVFKVLDVETSPTTDKDRAFLNIVGSLTDEEAEHDGDSAFMMTGANGHRSFSPGRGNGR
jgi:DNA-directed RNA polymerase I subunit RPA43